MTKPSHVILFSHKRKAELVPKKATPALQLLKAQKTFFKRIIIINLPVCQRSPATVTKRVPVMTTPRLRSLKSLKEVPKKNSVCESNQLIQNNQNNWSTCLERLSQMWNSPIYAFFEPLPKITVINGQQSHEFICSAPICKGNGSDKRVVWHFLDKADKGSTSNMRKHAQHCWGNDIIKKADEAKHELTLDNIREGLKEAKMEDGSIVAFFDRKGKGRVKYMLHQHTYAEAQSVLDKMQVTVVNLLIY